MPAAISAKEAGATVALIQKEATAISQGNTAGDFYCGIDYTMWMPGLSLGRAHTQGYVVGKYVAKL